MKVLGLDIGTNSIGWGIVDETEHKIIKCGVYIFPEGVKKEKGNESSKAAERTRYRSARRLKFRRKLRKYETLKVLIKNQMCPLSLEELELWRKEKIYPSSNDFVKWYRTDENTNWEPYFLRKKCVEEKAEKDKLWKIELTVPTEYIEIVDRIEVIRTQGKSATLRFTNGNAHGIIDALVLAFLVGTFGGVMLMIILKFIIL